MQRLLTMFRPAVHHRMDMLEELCKRIQHCRHHGTKEKLGVVGSKFDRFQTSPSNKQHGLQRDGVFDEQCCICLDGTEKGGLGKLKGEKGK